MTHFDDIEQWRPIECTDGAYAISSWGRVRRETPNAHHRAGYIKALVKVGTKKFGMYLGVSLMVDGRARMRLVHRLVAEAFLGASPEPKHQVNHIDGVKANNHVSNLEWMTDSENKLHAIATGLRLPSHTPRPWKNRRLGPPRMRPQWQRLDRGTPPLCLCGCGQETGRVKRKGGLVHPDNPYFNSFLQGHHRRLTNASN